MAEAMKIGARSAVGSGTSPSRSVVGVQAPVIGVQGLEFFESHSW